MKSIAFGFLATAIAATSAIAGAPDVSKDKTTLPPVIPCFRDQELQLDIFGSYMNLPHGDRQEELGRNPGTNGGGGGVGINYFFTRYIGLGADGSLNSNRGGVWDYTGKLIVRFPIEMGSFCLAPYIFGGGGGQSYERHDGTVGAYMTGGGLEWRATPHIGVFTEGRYTWTSNGNNGDNAQARLGLRIAF